MLRISELISAIVSCCADKDEYLMGKYFDKIIVDDDYNMTIYFADSSITIDEYGQITSYSNDD